MTKPAPSLDNGVMPKLKKALAGLIISVVATTGFFSLASAQSQPTTTEHLNRIRTNCVSAKNTLAQLQTSDALLRVNRGQLYEYMTTKLMSRFNTRLGNNGYDNRSLNAVTDYYNGVLAQFRTDYQSYAEQLSTALKVDCSADPAGFYSAVQNAREKRSQVHQDILRLNQNLGEYRSAFNAFVIDFNRKAGR